MMRSFGVARLSVVDVRPAAAFRQSHVPFAINVPAEVFRSHLASPAKLAEALGAAGVDAAHEAVIVSDRGMNPDSALAFLLLEKLGQARVSVLSDSVDDWGFAGLPLNKESDAADPKKTPPGLLPSAPAYPVNLRPGIVTDGAQGTKGLYPKVYVASGKALPARVPEGKVVHVPYTDLLNANGTPKAAKDIWNTLVKAGVPRYAEIVSISDDPGEAAANYFVLKLMGYPDVKAQVGHSLLSAFALGSRPSLPHEPHHARERGEERDRPLSQGGHGRALPPAAHEVAERRRAVRPADGGHDRLAEGGRVDHRDGVRRAVRHVGEGPRGCTATPTGIAPMGTSATTVLVPVSTTATLFAIWSAAYTRVPAGFTARP